MYRKRFEYAQNAIATDSIAKHLVIDLSSEINSGDFVLEIGPGGGMLTNHIINKVGAEGKVLAVEIDANLAQKLKEKYSGNKATEIINDDFLNSTLPKNSFKILSNIPFNTTSTILRKVLDPCENLKVAYFILQKEAFEMLGGRGVGAQKETMKSLLYYPFWEMTKVCDLRPNDFIPRTGVKVVYACFQRRGRPFVVIEDFERYEQFVMDISEVKVGQGVWKKIFATGRVDQRLKDSLVFDRGIASQKVETIVEVFIAVTG